MNAGAKRLIQLLAWVGSLGPMPATPLGPGDEVVVVYNKRVPESKKLAAYYAERRHVPADQVLGFDMTSSEDISRSEFHDDLQQPLAKALEGRKLWHIAPETIPAATNRPAHVEFRVVRSRIRYAVLCYGIPLRIPDDPNLKEEAEETIKPELRRNGAAVDSELACLPLIEQKLPLSGPLRSLLYSTTNAAFLHPTNGILMVARLDGPTSEIARGLVDKALEAETNGLWGRAYFDLRNTSVPGLKIGDDWIRSAAQLCRRLGFETVADENPSTFPADFPMSQIAIYLGWYDENVSGPFAEPVVEFMPGAFGYHLHSFSAASLRTTTRNWVGPLLSKGVTITMGCVAEPYLVGTPDLAVFISRLVYAGFTFGEAAYASQLLLSWQTTVVGDPLYRPFGKNLDLLEQELEHRGSPLKEWGYLRLLDLNLANGKPVGQVADFLEQFAPAKHSAILTEKLADLYAALGKPSSAVHAYAQALTLNPSPQQRIRIRLVLADKLSALNQDAGAFTNYQAILSECPDYPDKPAIYRRLLPLARKLDRKADVETYEGALRPPGDESK